MFVHHMFGNAKTTTTTTIKMMAKWFGFVVIVFLARLNIAHTKKDQKSIKQTKG